MNDQITRRVVYGIVYINRAYSVVKPYRCYITIRRETIKVFA
jgi:hypothetical protein